jgi:hypothetical protein
VGEGIRFARSGASDDQQWWSNMIIAGYAVLDGSALFRIERLKI